MTRRELIVCLLAAACSRSEKPKEASANAAVPVRPVEAGLAPPCDTVELVEWTFEGVSTRAAILTAPRAPPKRLPILVALHGRGEALKGPERGALGWPNDYALTHALSRLCAPPLTADDFEGLVTPEHLGELNRELASRPWEGLVVACPYLPDLDVRRTSEVAGYGRFVTGSLLPRATRELPVLAGASSTGIDGVSLGGVVALRVGLGAPETFGAVGALQPAIDDAAVSDLSELVRSARAKRPALSLRLTTSHDDVYRDITRTLSTAWQKLGVAHDFSELPGPHDYVFNRGPGAYEMVTWHRRALATP